MSRYQESDGDEYNNASEFWYQNLQKALVGKRGKKALSDLKAALEALPEKRLIERALCTVGGVEKRPEIEGLGQPEGVCAVGAYIWWQKVKQGKDPMQAFEELDTLPDEEGDIWDTVDAAESAGLGRVLAWELAYRNDEEYGGLRPEQRYQRFMDWIDKTLALPAYTPPPPKPPKPAKRTKFSEPSPFQQQAMPV